MRGARTATLAFAVLIGVVAAEARALEAQGESMSNEQSNEPFSLRELAAAQTEPPPPPETTTATDGVQLAVRVYAPQRPRASLVFYHGGGAHSGAGYTHLARGLSKEFDVAVYTPDLRGHGASGGPRGDAPSVDQVMRDVSTMIELARKAHPDVPVFLGGHSSGGGLVVNYAAWPERLPTAGYLLLSPQLGFRSDTERPDLESDFATASIWPFVVNGITGALGSYKAVLFNYPPELLAADPGMVSWNTVNMSNAITPQAPHDQIRDIELPFGLFIGAEDEIFDAERVTAFAKQIRNPAPGTRGVVLPGQNHLGILVDAHQSLGPWIIERTTTDQEQ